METAIAEDDRLGLETWLERAGQLTGASGVLKPKLATHVTADLGLWLGDEPTTHGGVLVVPGAAVRAFNDRTAAAAAAASPAGAPL